MKKLSVCMLLVLIITFTAVPALAAPDYQGLADIYNAKSSDTLQIDCRYDEATNAFNMLLTYHETKETLDQVFAADATTKSDLVSVFSVFGENIRATLDSAGCTDVATLVIACSSDLYPLYIDHNGAAVSWMLGE